MWKRDSAAPRRGPVARRGGALRRTSVLRSKTLPQAEFTSAEEDQKGGPRGMGHPVGRSCTRGRWATQSFKKCMRAPMWKRVSAAPRRGPWIRKGVCTFLVPPRKVPKRMREKGDTRRGHALRSMCRLRLRAAPSGQNGGPGGPLARWGKDEQGSGRSFRNTWRKRSSAYFARTPSPRMPPSALRGGSIPQPCRLPLCMEHSGADAPRSCSPGGYFQ